VIERIINGGLRRLTPNTIVDPDQLQAELATIRACGYAVDECEYEPDLRCIGAPIRNAAGRVFAAISVTGPSRRVTLERVPQLAQIVMTHAELLSIRLGYQPDQADNQNPPKIRDAVRA
jgi:DNA-binding IclR family transcriptional regulator